MKKISMKKISLVAAGLVALGWATTARADDVGVGADVNVPSPAPGSATDTVKRPTTINTPNTTVTAPPGSTTTVHTPGQPTTTGTSDPMATEPAAPADSVTSGDTSAPVTNVEITTPPPVVKNNTVVMPPAPAPIQPVAPADNRYVESQYARPGFMPRIGAGVVVGGGVQDFTRSTARDVTGTAGFWNARLLLGTRQFVGFEAAYLGSAQNINALGLDSDALLVSNGAEGALRINIPIARRASLVEPFGFVGAGWSRYHVARSATNTSSVAGNDDILAVPYGAGVALGYAGFMADARFTYRSTFYNDLLRASSTGNSARLDNWSVGGQVGFEF